MQKYKRVWLGLTGVALLCGMVQLGPAIGRTIGHESAFSLPKALLTIYMGPQRVSLLTADGRKIIGRRGPGPGERELTAFMAARGWEQKEIVRDPQRAAHAGNPVAVAGHTEISYEQHGVRLNALGRFRKGFWWYDLDKAP